MITSHPVPAGPVRGPDEACRLLAGRAPAAPALALLLPGPRGGRLLVGGLADAEDLCGAARAAGAENAVAFLLLPAGANACADPDMPAAFDKLRGEVADILLVRGERRWSLLCTGPRCCPPEGVRWRAAERT